MDTTERKIREVFEDAMAGENADEAMFFLNAGPQAGDRLDDYPWPQETDTIDQLIDYMVKTTRDREIEKIDHLLISEHGLMIRWQRVFKIACEQHHLSPTDMRAQVIAGFDQRGYQQQRVLEDIPQEERQASLSNASAQEGQNSAPQINKKRKRASPATTDGPRRKSTRRNASQSANHDAGGEPGPATQLPDQRQQQLPQQDGRQSQAQQAQAQTQTQTQAQAQARFQYSNGNSPQMPQPQFNPAAQQYGYDWGNGQSQYDSNGNPWATPQPQPQQPMYQQMMQQQWQQPPYYPQSQYTGMDWNPSAAPQQQQEHHIYHFAPQAQAGDNGEHGSLPTAPQPQPQHQPHPQASSDAESPDVLFICSKPISEPYQDNRSGQQFLAHPYPKIPTSVPARGLPCSNNAGSSSAPQRAQRPSSAPETSEAILARQSAAKELEQKKAREKQIKARDTELRRRYSDPWDLKKAAEKQQAEEDAVIQAVLRNLPAENAGGETSLEGMVDGQNSHGRKATKAAPAPKPKQARQDVVPVPTEAEPADLEMEDGNGFDGPEFEKEWSELVLMDPTEGEAEPDKNIEPKDAGTGQTVEETEEDDGWDKAVEDLEDSPELDGGDEQTVRREEEGDGWDEAEADLENSSELADEEAGHTVAGLDGPMDGQEAAEIGGQDLNGQGEADSLPQDSSQLFDAGSGYYDTMNALGDQVPSDTTMQGGQFSSLIQDMRHASGPYDTANDDLNSLFGDEILAAA